MFRNRRQLRRWAARALLVWLFGVASGVAQACLTPSAPGIGGQRSTSATAVRTEHGIALAGQAHPDSNPGDDGLQGHNSLPAKSNCVDFCEKSALAIPQLKSVLDKVQGDALALVAVPLMTALAPAAAPLQPALPRRQDAQAPPIRLSFVRLAL